MKYFLGIDPGLSGALALYDPLTDELIIKDMPTFTKKVGGKQKRILDLYGLANIIDPYVPHIKKAIVEQVGAAPGQGVTSMFSFGFSAGCAQMVVAANFIPMTTELPQIWKKAMRLGKGKDAARQEASRLLPRHSEKWARVKDDGRAEAALLAVYLAKRESN